MNWHRTWTDHYESPGIAKLGQDRIDALLEVLFGEVCIQGVDTLAPLRGAWVLMHGTTSGHITGLLFDSKLQQIPLINNERIHVWYDTQEIQSDQYGEYTLVQNDKSLVSIFDAQDKELARMELLGFKQFDTYAKLMEWVKNERGN